MSLSGVLATLALPSLAVLLFLVFRLRKSEGRFRLLAENASDLVSYHRPDGRYVWVSPSVTRLLGFKPREWVGRDPCQFVHPDDLNQFQANGPTQLNGGDQAPLTFRVKTKGGGYLWVETVTSSVKNRKGNVVGLVSVLRDVSGRKEAEQLYRFLIRHLPNTSVFLFDREFKHRVADGTITGHTIPPSDTLEGLSLWQVFPKDMASILAPFYKGVFDSGVLRTEQHFRTRTYRIHFLPVHGSTGTVELGMAVFLDVTDEKARTAALEDRTHDLERSNRDLEQFAHVASHELKAPLRRISSFAELLFAEYQGNLSGEADEYLHHIVDGVGSLQAVLESLLTYSRVQVDRSHMDWVDTNQVFEASLRNLAAKIQETGAFVTKGSLPDKVTADDTLLQQLFENLVGNAIKFNTTGRRPKVHVTCERKLLDWEFTVKDNGPGLDPAYKTKVFAMFQRLHPDVEGTGIGLALCKKIVGIHRGKIWFESVVGQGTSFKFSLPARSPGETTQH